MDVCRVPLATRDAQEGRDYIGAWPASANATATTVTTAKKSSREALRWLREGRRVVAARLVEAEGSVPLSVGAVMYVSAGPVVEGSITGGCVESKVAEHALEILDGRSRPARLVFGISDEDAGAVGLMCGGTVHIFVHELTDSVAAQRALAADVDGARFALATALDGEHAGAQMTISGDAVVGSLGETQLDETVLREARGFLSHGKTTTRRYGSDGATLGDDVSVHIASVGAPPAMVLVGAVDFAAAVAEIASHVGYHVIVIDPRPAFTSSPRFGAADRIDAWPDAAIGNLDLNPADAVIVFSHNPAFDVPALLGAFETGVGYIGALGSRKTAAERVARLRESGASDSSIARLHAPCGLDIGATTPEETALAILAEVVASRSGRRGDPLRETDGPVRDQRT